MVLLENYFFAEGELKAAIAVTILIVSLDQIIDKKEDFVQFFYKINV